MIYVGWQSNSAPFFSKKCCRQLKKIKKELQTGNTTPISKVLGYNNLKTQLFLSSCKKQKT